MSELSDQWGPVDSDDEDLGNGPAHGDQIKYESNTEPWDYEGSPVSSPGDHDVHSHLLELEDAEESMGSRGDVYIQILRQPEDTHRARYMSEGSRGAIKDQSGASHCTVQLMGYNRPTGLQIFAGTATDPLKPHPFYRLIPVTGKGSGQITKCREITAHDGIQCIEVMLRPEREMTAVLDCIGILKMCSAETKRRRGKASTASTIRIVFRVHVPLSQNDSEITKLQVLSTPIYCGQQLGYPEVRRASRSSGTVRGGAEVFVIGRNFDKNTRAHFREYDHDGQLVWNADALMESEFLSQCHMIFTTPAYRDLSIKQNVEVTMTVECGSKTSHPMPFIYTPEPNKEGRRNRDAVSVSTSEWAGSSVDILPNTTVTSSSTSSFSSNRRLSNAGGSGSFGCNSCSPSTPVRSAPIKLKAKKRPPMPQSPTLTKILRSLEEAQGIEESTNFVASAASAASISSVTLPSSSTTVPVAPVCFTQPLTIAGQQWSSMAMMNNYLVPLGVQVGFGDSNTVTNERALEEQGRKSKQRRTVESLTISPISANGDTPQGWF